MLFRKTAPLNYLSLIPARKVTEFEEMDGKVTLLLPKFKNRNLRRWLVPKHRSPYFKIHLDEMGSSIWRLVDGQKTVGEICALMDTELQAQSKPTAQLDERVTAFFTNLFKNGFVTFNEDVSQSGV